VGAGRGPKNADLGSWGSGLEDGIFSMEAVREFYRLVRLVSWGFFVANGRNQSVGMG
jgi:hypothetical protein